jgi:hypothetical protein
LDFCLSSCYDFGRVFQLHPHNSTILQQNVRLLGIIL